MFTGLVKWFIEADDVVHSFYCRWFSERAISLYANLARSRCMYSRKSVIMRGKRSN